MKRKEEDAVALSRRVREANRILYDEVASAYEQVDGRRSPRTAAWLKGKLKRLRSKSPGGSLLDVGCGSGFLSRAAEGLFNLRVGVDISPEILFMHKDAFDFCVASEVESLPFPNRCFDAVAAFATLHHICEFEGLIAEICRVLRPGGVFYSDHDMDAAFRCRFKLPLKIYRRLRNAKAKYVEAGGRITDEIYALSEFHEDGIPVESICECLERFGFESNVEFHWYGLNPLADSLLGSRSYRRGWAPLVSITAVKKEER